MSKRFLFLFMVVIIAINLTSSLSLANDVKITKSGYIASVSFDDLKKTLKYINAYDDVAFQKMLDSNLVFFLREGLQVQIMEFKFFSGMIKIRPVGGILEVWTIIEAVENK